MLLTNVIRHVRYGAQVAVALALLVACLIVPARADESPVEFMQKVSRELIGAAKTQSQQAFTDVINKYGHVPAIGNFALGSFKPQLQAPDRTTYYNGMVRFISRYAASASQNYSVTTAEIMSPAQKTEKGIYVDSRVRFADGSSYDVQWTLMPQGGTYRVVDANVLSISLANQLKDLFETYIKDNGGTVKALMIALNR
jgi:phospholipid transport system substrate-binding protein